MPDLLDVSAFTPDLLLEVQDFDYGEEPYQKELAEWMRNEAVPALKRGSKVWLYINQATEIVGYSSLGVTRWRYPGPTSRKTELVIVPAVALRKAFWGKPDGPADERYSSQIMRHLLDEARDWSGELPALGLFVHPDNLAATKLYERFGFRPFFHTYTDPGTKVTYRSYVRPLVRG
ncbi:MAG: GNAT family N-acetyltransferase [Planctomycetes bacterium]|nr:GNAT family N-acetyltransferase [Planctomycetota bacterium]